MAVAHATDLGRNRIPLGLKVAYSEFMSVLVPYYLLAYGPGISCGSATLLWSSRWWPCGESRGISRVCRLLR